MANAVRKRRDRMVDQTPPRYQGLVDGTMSIEDLDIEELSRGQLRDKNGQFTGRPANVIPREMTIKLAQELLTRGDGTWRENYMRAMEVFVEIMENPRARPQDRLYAAQYVIERVAGKIPEKQVVEASIRKWEEVADAVMVEVAVDPIAEDMVLEGEVVERTAIESGPAQAVRTAPRRPTRRKSTREDG